MSHKKSRSHKRGGSGNPAPGAPLPLPVPETRSHRPVREIKHLNTRFLLGLGVSLAVIGIGVHFLHGYQVNRNAVALKELSEQAALEGNDDQAIQLLGQYLQFRPDDLDATARLGIMVDQSAPSLQTYRRAYRIFSQVLREDPYREDASRLRYRLANLMYGLQEYEQANGQIQTLHAELDAYEKAHAQAALDSEENSDGLSSIPYNRGDLLLLQGRCAARRERQPEALTSFLAGIAVDASRVDHYVAAIEVVSRLGDRIPQRDVLEGHLQKHDWKQATIPESLTKFFPAPSRSKPKPAQGADANAAETTPGSETPEASSEDVSITGAQPLIDDLLSRMERAVEPKFKAHLARAAYFARLGDDEKTAAEIQRARGLAPSDPDVRQYAATFALSRAETLALDLKPAESLAAVEEAIVLLTIGLEEDPLNLGYELLLSRAELQRAVKDKALDRPARNAAIARVEARLEGAIERIPEARAAVMKIEQREERDRKLMQASQLEVDLRIQLLDVKFALLEAGDTPAERIATLQDDVGKRIEEVHLLVQMPGVNQFLKSKQLYTNLLVANRGNAHAGKSAPKGAGGSWNDAIAELQQARLYFSSEPRFRQQIDLMLVRCFREVRNPEARATLLRDATQREPGWLMGRIELAQALDDLGQDEQAYQQFVSIFNQYRLGGIPETLAKMQIRRQLLLAPEFRNWTASRAAVDQLLAADANNASALLLDAELKLQQGDLPGAEQVVQALIDRDDLSREEQIQTWVTAIRLPLLRGDQDVALRAGTARIALQTAEEKLGKSGPLAIAGLSIAQTVSEEQLRKEADALAGAVDEYPLEDRATLRESLAGVYARLNLVEQRDDLREQLAATHPDHLGYHVALAESALNRKDDAAFQKHLAEIRRIEGPQGPYGNLVEAAALGEKLSPNQKPALKDTERTKLYARAMQLLKDAETRRPQWQAIPMAQARIAGHLNDKARQYDFHRRALDLGDIDRATFLAMLDYLKDENRHGEVAALTERVRREQPDIVTTDVTVRQMQSYFYLQKQDEAIALLRQVTENSEPFRKSLLEGELQFIEYAAIRQIDPKSDRLPKLYESAKQHFEDAVASAPDQHLVWRAYIDFQLRTANPDAARELIARAEQSLPAAPPALKPLALGIYREMVGDVDLARERYLQALALEPNNIQVNVELAGFYARTNDRAAQIEQLKKLKALVGDSQPGISRDIEARLNLLAGTSGTYPAALEVVNRLEKEYPAEREAQLQNLKVRITILTRYPVREFHLKLIDALEQYHALDPLPVSDRLTLINLYRTIRDEARSQSEAKTLLEKYPNDRLILAYFIERSIETENFTDAETHLIELSKQLPDSFTIVALKARLEHARSNTDAAVAVLEQSLASLPPNFSAYQIFWDTVSRANYPLAFNWLPGLPGMRESKQLSNLVAGLNQLRNRDYDLALTTLTPVLELPVVQQYIRAERLRSTSALLDTFGRLADAERLYRQYLAESPTPGDMGMLISLIGRQGRVEEAMALCESSLQTAGPEQVLHNAIALVRQFPHTPEQAQRVMAMIQSTLAERPDDPEVLRHLADFQDFQKDFAAAEQTYQKILAKQPGNLLALNNLAWLLSMRQPVPERVQLARKLIDQAIELRGPIAELLDTKAVVELADKKAKAAVTLLERAQTASPSPAKRLNLARAYLQLQQTKEARIAFEGSLADGLQVSSLHPLEVPMYQETQQKITAAK